MLNCAERTQLPALDIRKREEVFMCPIQDSAVLLGSHDLKMSGVTTFWKSPYNGVVKMNSSPVYKGSRSMNFESSSSESSKPLGLVKGILKNSRTRDSESDSSSSDDSKKLRGILTKRSDSADTKKRSGKRVKFDDKLIRLHEIGRRYAVPCNKDVPESKPVVDCSRVLREINANRFVNDDNIMCPSRMSSASNQVFFKPGSSVSDSSCGYSSKYSSQSEGCRFHFDRELRTSSARMCNENIKIIELDRTKDRHPRMCRAYTSPMLYSQRFPRKSSAQNVVIYRHELAHADDRNSNRSFKSNGSGSRQRIVLQSPSIVSNRSDTSNSSLLNRMNFCNDDKTTQIVRWLRNVNDTQAKEGRCACTVLLPVAHHDVRQS